MRMVVQGGGAVHSSAPGMGRSRRRHGGVLADAFSPPNFLQVRGQLNGRSSVQAQGPFAEYSSGADGVSSTLQSVLTTTEQHLDDLRKTEGNAKATYQDLVDSLGPEISAKQRAIQDGKIALAQSQ